MHADDLFVHVHRRKLCCVLDPMLVLGTRVGCVFAVRLAQVLEPWLTRSFWQVIDASDWLMPALVAAHPVGGGETGAQEPADDLTRPLHEVLQSWIALRDRTDAGSWPFRWIGDNLAGSQLQASVDASVVTRYEVLAEALSAQAVFTEAFALDPLSGWDQADASLDALALSVALDGAVVLTASARDAQPWPVQALARIGRPARLLDPVPDARAVSIFGAERDVLRHALAAAGLAGMVQELPRLAALHVNLSYAASFRWLGNGQVREPDAGNPWNGAQAWWYYL
jgi:hypothetical protein